MTTARTRIAALSSAVLVALAVGGGTASATPNSSTASCMGAVSWNRASALVGRVATVKGRVAGTFFASSSNGSPTFLDLGVDYPNPSRFTVVIWGRDRARFRSPERTYRGRTILSAGSSAPTKEWPKSSLHRHPRSRSDSHLGTASAVSIDAEHCLGANTSSSRAASRLSLLPMIEPCR